MNDRNDLLDHAVDLFPAPEGSVAEVHRHVARRQRNRKLGVGAVVIGIWLVIGLVAVRLRSHDESVPAQRPSVGGWILIEGDGGNRAVAPDGSEETVLLDGRKNLWAEDWSPDGSRLLVALSGGDLAVIEPDGSETTLVRFDNGDTSFEGASLSPDGATVVYATLARAGQLWTIASDGSREPRLLLESKADELSQPTYSPDGTRIAYVAGGGDHGHTIRVVNADGTDVRVLIHATPPFDAVSHIHGLEWSPDGSLIAVGLADGLEGQGIYTVRPDGTDLRLLIPGADYPVWSPDGSMIAYSTQSAGPVPSGVWVANADGSDPRLLTAGGDAVAWNPGAPADRA